MPAPRLKALRTRVPAFAASKAFRSPSRLRRNPPQPVQKWHGARKGGKFGPRRMQRGVFGDMNFRSKGMDGYKVSKVMIGILFRRTVMKTPLRQGKRH
jgi:hypothetical protein